MTKIAQNLCEVVGLPGSGKSHICQQLLKKHSTSLKFISNNRKAVDRRFHYLMLPARKRPSALHRLLRLTKLPFRDKLFEGYLAHLILENLKESGIPYPKYIDYFEENLALSEEKPVNQLLLRSSIISSLFHFSAMENEISLKRKVLLQDAGNVFQSTYLIGHFFSDDVLDLNKVDYHLQRLPFFPSIVLFKDEDEQTCLSRFASRDIGRPQIYLGLTDTEILDALRKKRELLHAIISRLKDKSVKVIIAGDRDWQADWFYHVEQHILTD